MKTEQIKIGNVYAAKVTDKVVPVRINKENPRGGWDGTNLQTNRAVRIKSARKLRNRITVPPREGDEPKPTAKGPVKKKLTTAERRARVNKPQAKADKPVSGAKAAKASGASGGKKLSLIDAAIQVLGDSKEPMGTKQMVEVITQRGLWETGKGKTPHATLYSAILRELQIKGDAARFTKVERGRFTLAKGA